MNKYDIYNMFFDINITTYTTDPKFTMILRLFVLEIFFHRELRTKKCST
jgi:hypothetical protein